MPFNLLSPTGNLFWHKMVLLKLHDPNKSYTLPLSRSRLCAPNVSTWLVFSSDKDSLHLFDAALIILALKQ